MVDVAEGVGKKEGKGKELGKYGIGVGVGGGGRGVEERS